MALLVPSVEYGTYWRPVLAALAKRLPVRFFTARLWREYDPEEPGAHVVRQVGRMTFRSTQTGAAGYTPGVMVLSPRVLLDLLRFRPDVVFTQAFSLWTVLVVLAQPFLRYRSVLLLDGSSPNVDLVERRLRLLIRRFLARSATMCAANSKGAAAFLRDACGVPANDSACCATSCPTRRRSGRARRTA